MPSLSKNNVKIVIVTDADTKGVDKIKAALGELDDESKKSQGAFAKLGGVASFAAKAVAAAGIAAGGAAAGGILKASLAAFGQVKAVEDASFALRAYESDVGKVNTILADLVKYARSDMGVLFQRQDLFKAASNLRGFGESAETVTDRVKTLSKGVALGMTTFDELSQIIGRTTQAGKLTADAFDQLASRGIILDSSLRGAEITSGDLYKALEKALPDSILAGRANTIEGRMIRLQSAFRDVGASVLGVDRETSKFIAGGLGDRMMNGLDRLTTLLKQLSPIVSTGTQRMMEMTQHIGTLQGYVERARVAIGFIISSFQTGSITAGGFTGTLQKVAAVIRTVWEFIAGMLSPSLKALWNTIQNELIPVWNRLYAILKPVIIPTLLVIAGILGGLLIAAVWVFVNALNNLISVSSWVVKAFINMRQMFIDVVGTIIGYAGNLPVIIQSRLGGLYNILTAPFRAVMWFLQHTFIGQVVRSVSGIGGAIKNAVGNIDIPGPLGLVRNVIPGWQTGGFTGKGDSDEVAGIVHKGEYVIPKNQVNQSTGLPKNAIGGGSQTIYNIARVELNTAVAVREFMNISDRNSFLASQGLSTIRA